MTDGSEPPLAQLPRLVNVFWNPVKTCRIPNIFIFVLCMYCHIYNLLLLLLLWPKEMNSKLNRDILLI